MKGRYVMTDKNNEGREPLKNMMEIIESGVDLNLVNRFNETAEELAGKHGHLECAMTLRPTA